MNEWKGEWEWHPSPFRKGWGKRGDKRGRKRIEPTHISTSHKGSFCSQEFGKTIAVLLNPCPLRQAYESPAFVSSLTTFSISSRSHWDVSLTISTSFGRKWQHGSFFLFFFFPPSPFLPLTCPKKCSTAWCTNSSPSAWCPSLLGSDLGLSRRCSPCCSFEQFQQRTGLRWHLEMPEQTTERKNTPECLVSRSCVRCHSFSWTFTSMPATVRGSKPSHTSMTKVSPVARKTLTASVWVMPRRLWLLTSRILIPTFRRPSRAAAPLQLT